MADLSLRLLADAGGAVSAFRDVGGAATAAGAVIKQFAVDSVKAFMEAERVQKQLARAAGENTEAFTAMADAMSAELAVEDEHIKQLQTLSLSYGVLPQQVEGATRAVLDYAAATGRDATQAMQQLINGVEAGNGTLGRMGVTFDTTGDQAQDLQNAIDALNKKFGGAAAADADTLAGGARAAETAVGELKETFGSFIGLLEQKSGVMSAATSYLRGINAAIQLAAGGNLQAAGVAYLAANQSFGGGVSIGPGQGPAVKPGASGGGAAISFGDLSLEPGKKKGGKGGDFGWGPWGNPSSDFDNWLEDYEKAAQDKMNAMANQALAEAAQANKFREAESEAESKHDAAMLEAHQKVAKLEIDVEYKTQRDLEAAREKAQAESDKRFKHMEEQWHSAGDRIGAALVNAIGNQLMRLAEGGDVDPAEVAGDVVSTILSIAGFALGTYLGAPQIGGAIGGLAGMGAKAAIVGGFGRKKHDGGWIERFHGGGWPTGGDEVPAILQTGERVLSRREVSMMGGARAVDSAARGRGGVVMNISTLDALSFQETFGGDGGRGFYNAIRIGRGDVAQLFNRE